MIHQQTFNESIQNFENKRPENIWNVLYNLTKANVAFKNVLQWCVPLAKDVQSNQSQTHQCNYTDLYSDT